MSINVMTLGGIAVALGELVDDAIVDVENIVRRLRESRENNTGVSTAKVVLEASVEVRGAVVYASLIEALALLPVFFLTGLTGSFFKPLATSYAGPSTIVVTATISAINCPFKVTKNHSTQ